MTISALRLISEFSQGETVTAIDYIVLAVSIIMFVSQAFLEVMVFLLANNKDPVAAQKWQLMLAITFVVNILFDVLLLVATTYTLISPLTPDFEELIRELLTLFVGYLSLNIITLAICLIVFVNYLYATKSTPYLLLPTRPQEPAYPRLEEFPPVVY